MKETGKKPLRGSLLLLLGAMIWGAAFVAQRMGMDHLGPFAFSGIRMLLAGLVMIPVAAMTEKRAGAEDKTPAMKKNQRKAGLLCGLFLFAATCLQQAGLVSTSAGKAGFITALYVVLVPVAGYAVFRIRSGRAVWLGVIMAVAALYLLCIPEGGFRMERGDLLLLGCALCFTGQILCIDHYAGGVNGAALARDEFLITGTLSLIIAVFTETLSWEGIREAMIPILYTGILSGAVGYTLQIFGQKDLSPTMASLLMCLESVFAVLTGVIVLGERMTARETAGCVLMFAAVLLAQLSPVLEARMFGKKKTSPEEEPQP